MTFSIYIIRNKINQKVYIGQTAKLLEQRLVEHSRNNSGCIKIRRAIQKYGLDKFYIELLATTDAKELADHLEIYFISFFNSVNIGYNIRSGGSRGKLPLESRKRISEASKKQVNRYKWPQGKKHTENEKIKISQSLKNRVISPGTGKKITASKLGRKLVIIDGKRFYRFPEKESE